MPDYTINLKDKFASLRLIDVGAEAAAVGDEWVNQTLTTVNELGNPARRPASQVLVVD